MNIYAQHTEHDLNISDCFLQTLIHTELIHTPQVHKTVFYAFTLLINYSISGAKIYVNCTSKLYLIDGFMLMYSEDMERYICTSKHSTWMLSVHTFQNHLIERFRDIFSLVLNYFGCAEILHWEKTEYKKALKGTSKSFILQLCNIMLKWTHIWGNV